MNTAEFITRYRESDIRQLALQSRKYPEVDMPFALDQISGWQTARKKLPQWAAQDGIIFPPHLSMEQCSSEQTALYKSSLITPPSGAGGLFVDLTGGFGVDFSYICRNFHRAVYVERQPRLCEIACHNFGVLGLNHAEVVCSDGVEYLRQMPEADLIYLDPARRDDRGGRTYAIEDCTPNVVELQHLLLQKGRRVIIKLSPMLDWHKAVEDLRNVSEVHIVSVQNECKELLVVMDRDPHPLTVHCINDRQSFIIGQPISDTQDNEWTSSSNTSTPVAGQFLFVPNASIMKSGLFAELASAFSLSQIAPSSHLFLSSEPKPDFPGRKFRIDRVTTMNKKELKQFLDGVDSANIACRNFPLTPVDLRKRLKLKDGGSNYIFATTASNGSHILLLSMGALSAPPHTPTFPPVCP